MREGCTTLPLPALLVNAIALVQSPKASLSVGTIEHVHSMCSAFTARLKASSERGLQRGETMAREANSKLATRRAVDPMLPGILGETRTNLNASRVLGLLGADLAGNCAEA